VDMSMNVGVKFLIVGTGRCGTGYISRVLTRVGVKCGHENVFSIHGIKPNKDYIGDASWLAVPFLPNFDPESVFVVHQIRHPFKTIGSLVSIPGLLQKPFTPYGEYIAHMVPLIWDKDYNLSLFERGA